MISWNTLRAASPIVAIDMASIIAADLDGLASSSALQILCFIHRHPDGEIYKLVVRLRQGFI